MDPATRAAEVTRQWSLIHRVAFRFCFLYFVLTCVGTQVLGSLFPVPGLDVPNLSALFPARNITFWTAAHVFNAKLPLVYTGSGSGDKTFDWVLAFCTLVFSVLVSALWSILDRKRANYDTLHKWFRLFIRFALVSQMLTYGMAKVIPLQMPFPYLAKLLEPFRDFSPMGVLWSSIGASPSYEIFAGCAEVLAGVLLIFPRTTLLGALVCLADMTQVFMLNMTYDVPVKLFSFHLLLMALVLLAPEFNRLVQFFFSSRAVGPSTEPPLFNAQRANRIAVMAQVVFGIWLLGMHTYSGWTAWSTYGGGRAKSPLYGIWNVDELSIDGQLRSPLVTDNDRWRRAIFDFRERMSFQRMDESFAGYGCSINALAKTMKLTKSADKNWQANFTFERLADDRLVLDGDMDNHKIQVRMQLLDRGKFTLVNRGFHWIQEFPFNR